MSLISGKARIERLVETGLCKSADSEKHITQLKKLVSRMNDETIQRQSYILKALADPTRIKIIHLLKNRPMCTCEIMVSLGLKEPNASHHLNLLERNSVVKSERIGKWVFYKLQSSKIQNVFNDIIDR